MRDDQTRLSPADSELCQPLTPPAALDSDSCCGLPTVSDPASQTPIDTGIPDAYRHRHPRRLSTPASQTPIDPGIPDAYRHRHPRRQGYQSALLAPYRHSLKSTFRHVFMIVPNLALCSAPSKSVGFIGSFVCSRLAHSSSQSSSERVPLCLKCHPPSAMYGSDGIRFVLLVPPRPLQSLIMAARHRHEHCASHGFSWLA